MVDGHEDNRMTTSPHWQGLLQSQNLQKLLEILLSSRIPVTTSVLPYQFLLLTPCVYLAYLARRDGTYTLRLLMLPIVLSCILFFGWGFVWTDEGMHLRNWGQGCFAGIVIAKSLEYVFTKEGMLKIGEVRPGIRFEEKPIQSHSPQAARLKINGVVNGNGKHHLPPQSSIASSPRKRHQGLIDAFELLHTCRGLHFQFGIGVPIPAHTRPLHRRAFLSATSISLLLHFMALDVLDSALKLFPGVGSPSGGSIFYGSLNLPLRLLVATTIHIMTGCALMSGFKMVYDLVTLIAVGIFHSPPENWPPVMDDPWRADSLHRFWSKEWHQLLRRTFFVYGGYPARQLFRFFSVLFGKNDTVNDQKSSSSTQTVEHFSVVLGTFAASGLWHECTMYTMGKGFSWATVLFFITQTGLLIGERVWRKVMGKKVGGFWGRLWVYFVIFVLSQGMVDSWHRRGFGGGAIIPPSLSPVRVVALPLTKKGLATLA